MSAEDTITIHADFNWNPYAWRRKSTDPTLYVGDDKACSTLGLSKSIGSSVALDRDLSTWIERFHSANRKGTLDWDQFHADGLALAKRLKAEVGNRYEIEYAPPWMDPVRQGLPITRFLSAEETESYDPFPHPERNPSTGQLIDTLRMKLWDCSVGSIRMRLVCGNRRLLLNLSYVYDPIPCFIEWMEQLVADQEFCEFHTNEEGPEKTFQGINLPNGLVEFVIKDRNYKTVEYWRKIVRRRQLVETIYLGFQQFGQSPEYLPKEWESQSIGGWVAERTNLTEEEVLDALVALPIEELNPLLFLLSCLPVGGFLHVRLESMKSISELKDYALRTDCNDLDNLRARYESEWTGIDHHTADRREVIRDEFLSELFITWYGTPLRTLRSEKLDAYLASDRDRNTP